MLHDQKEGFDIYTVYCLKKTSAERCIDDLGGDQNAFLQVCITHSLHWHQCLLVVVGYIIIIIIIIT